MTVLQIRERRLGHSELVYEFSKAGAEELLGNSRLCFSYSKAEVKALEREALDFG